MTRPMMKTKSVKCVQVSSEGGFVAKRLEPQSGSVRFLHSFPRIGKADSEETDQPPLPDTVFCKDKTRYKKTNNQIFK